MKRAGFALIELLVVISIIGVATGMAVPMYREYQIRNDLNLATEQVAQGLARARLLAQSSQDDAGWGFYIPAGILFRGSSYADRDPSYDEVYPMPSTITPNGLYEVAYSQIVGRPSATGSITLTTLNEEQRTVLIEVEKESVAVVLTDTKVICHKPEGGNPVTMNVNENAWPAHQGHGDSEGPCPAGTSSVSSSGGNSSQSSTAMSSSLSSVSSSHSSVSSAPTVCQNRFSLASDGTITTLGALSVTFKALGTSITYGAGGPNINIDVERKKNNSNTGYSNGNYQELYDGDYITGGEIETATYAENRQVIVKFHASYKKKNVMTYERTKYSNDANGNVIILRNGDPLPDIQAFDNQANIESFLEDVLDQDNNVSIGAYNLILLVEYDSINSTAADFQDTVMILEFGEPTSC